MEYTYSLQKYTGRNSRHTCPACGRKFCFTLYVDAAGIRLLKMLEGVNIVIHVDMRKPLRCTLMRTRQSVRSSDPRQRLNRRKKKRRTTYIFSLIQQSENAPTIH